MNNVLIITFGNRDGMFVYGDLDNPSKYVRTKVNNCYDFKKKHKNINWIPVEKTEEDKPVKYKGLPIDGITFPMFEKTIKELQKQKIKIDSLYVISTDRTELIPKLDQIEKSLKEYENEYQKPLDYIRTIKGWIDKDCTSFFSDSLKDYLNKILKKDEKENIEEEIIEIANAVFSDKTELNFLKIGEGYKGFGKITSTNMMMKQKEEEKIRLLSEADFNNEYFFFPALNEKICRDIYFEKLGKTEKFFISHSGGMPVMQLTLLTILDSEFPDIPKKKIYFPERQNFSFQFPHIDYYNLFRMKRLVRFYMEHNKPEEAKNVLKELKNMSSIENIENKIDAIDELFAEGIPNRIEAILNRIDELINL